MRRPGLLARLLVFLVLLFAAGATALPVVEDWADDADGEEQPVEKEAKAKGERRDHTLRVPPPTSLGRLIEAPPPTVAALPRKPPRANRALPAPRLLI